MASHSLPTRRLPSRGAWSSALAIALAALLWPAAAGAQQTVTRVSVEAPGAFDAEGLLRVLGLAEGRPVDRQLLREAILALYAGGEIERIEVESEPLQGGLAVTVRISVRSKISKVDVRTGSPILRNQLKKWMALEPGEPVSVATVEAGRRRAERKLRERGHPEPRVDVYLDFERSSNTVAVTIEPDPGEVERIAGVVLEGIDDPAVAAETVPHIKPSDRLTSRVEERVRRDVEERLRRKGFWDARVVGVDRVSEDEATHLVVRVDPGARYTLELIAPAGSEEIARAAIPDPVEADIHPAQTEVLADRIRENLQRRGYLLAEATAELVADGLTHVLRVTIDPGRTFRIGSVEFPGAQSIDHDDLRAAVEVDRGRTQGLWGVPVSDVSLDADRRAVEEVYRAAGFVEVEAAPPILEASGTDEVRVLFPVVEGPRWVLDELRVEGLPVEAVARLDAVAVTLQENAPWNPRAVEATERQIEAALFNSGYPEGRVITEVDTSEPGHARVAFVVEPGSYVEIGDVVIAGLRRTRRSVVDRMLRAAGVASGAPFARDRLVEAQRRLYELGLFRSVELLPMPGQERRDVRGLVVHCEEGAQRSYLVGVGWNETDRWRLTLGWSHLNLFGGAHSLSLEGRLSVNEERFQVGLREPRVPYIDVPGYLVVYRTFERFDNRGYEQHRRGLWVDVGDRRRVPFRAWYRYEYQIVAPSTIGDVQTDPELPREDVDARISSITPTLEWDFRDDPLLPTRGSFSQVSAEWAFPVFAADASYLKLFGRSTLYGRHSHGTWAIGIRAGAIRPFDTTDELPLNLQVPVTSRYFAGGSSTHRGFERDRLGIPGQTLDAFGEPTGGNALVLVNLEYERPVAGMFSGVAFVDIGNIWSEPERVRVSDLRYAAGLGLRVITPAGPLRAEYGWKLDAEPGESSGEFFLSFGVPF
ncbi:MAG TPA: BamA/TamA family outer membrane protein [Thermoanaerobaculales bacterium]|mgnify:CR=1 FL=1|nr:BamA/TamA family outer membrane protein [Thermoanaerobaculales bacterium]HPA80395.1 BamA/TamA family outer membrane protein [Thermoanaerobaculales bacterium]HQL30040.1 BamA/TamA family outer membrane protein [Thermoanaerobaculales bacterium]HQN96816.1 BamA/TamA family outer membrane protein [Thermoanaerobaculales bacterium]